MLVLALGLGIGLGTRSTSGSPSKQEPIKGKDQTSSATVCYHLKKKKMIKITEPGDKILIMAGSLYYFDNVFSQLQFLYEILP